MFKYHAFDLRIGSNRVVPELLRAHFDSPPDVTVWQGVRPRVNGRAEPYPESVNGTTSRPSPIQMFHLVPSGITEIRYADGTKFYVDAAGSEIWTTWEEPYTVEDMATYLLGPILGFVLHLRDTTALHASSVVVGDGAVAIVGAPHAGKSSSAAAFAMRGYPILADDVSALDETQDGFTLRPAYPHLRLWPSSVEFLYGSADALRPITPNWDKRDFDLTDGYTYHNKRSPLRAVYVLGARSDDERAPYIEDLLGHECFMTLAAHTYTNRLLDESMQGRVFDVLGRLSAIVPVRRLVPHIDPARLDQLCNVIVEDLTNIRTLR